MRDLVLHRQEHAFQVDVDDVVPDLLRIVGDGNKCRASDPGVVERVIQTLPAAHGRVHQILDLIGASDVGRNENRIAPLGLNLADGFLAFGRAPGSDRHTGAFGGEREGRGPANPGTAAGDDGDLAFKQFAHIRRLIPHMLESQNTSLPCTGASFSSPLCARSQLTQTPSATSFCCAPAISAGSQAGIYGHLFLAQRSLLKIATIVRKEMDSIGAQEFHLPGLGFPDAMTSIAQELRSYKQLPQIWFTIEGSCSFDIDSAALDVSYEKHRAAYCRILDRCGLEYRLAGGGQAQDFVLRGAPYTETHDPEGDLTPEEFHTPSVKTIAEVAQFTGLPVTSQMKSLVMVASEQGAEQGSEQGKEKPVLALLRGDHQLNEAKLAGVLGVTGVRAAQPEELRQWFGADAGSLGPVGVKNVRILADNALRGRRNMIAGANKNDYHLRYVTPGEDFDAEFHDLRQAAEDDASVLAHMSKLGEKYSKSMDLHVTDKSGEEIAPMMGSYGIGVERILSAAVELDHDADGIVLPPAIAPFTVVVTPVNVKDDAQRQAAAEIYATFEKAGFDVLLDDRDERPGVKFKDADLIGIPYRITVGKKLPQGIVERVERRPKRSTDVPIAKVVDAVRELWTG